MTSNMCDLLVRHHQVKSVLDLKLKWRNVSDELRYFGISPDVWAFDELRKFIEERS